MQSFVICFVFSFFVLVSNALECEVNKKNPYGVAYSIFVAQDGSGKYTKIQEAVNEIPTNNFRWISINLKPGIYVEQVKIPREKECIVLVGRSAQDTIITNNQHEGSGSLQQSSTFGVYANNFIAKGITFKNTYKETNMTRYENDMLASNPQAVAFWAGGDKQAFYKCGFVGYQDTLWDENGRHFFSQCYVEGTIDFIFGDGQSIYSSCQINATGAGYITAQKRASPSDPGGYVFDNCQIFGNTNGVNLGRAYGPFSRVIYMNSKFENDIITPQGWYIWGQSGHEKDVTYAEVNCNGTDTSKRILEKTLSPAEIAQFTTKAFINQDGWLDQLPCFNCDFK